MDSSRACASSHSGKRRAATMGPTVCELDGPTPTLKPSKRLIVMAAPIGDGAPSRQGQNRNTEGDACGGGNGRLTGREIGRAWGSGRGGQDVLIRGGGGVITTKDNK